MQIKEDITLNLTSEEVTNIIKHYLKENGYETKSVYFDIKDKCQGFYGQESYVKYFAGANCKVERL